MDVHGPDLAAVQSRVAAIATAETPSVVFRLLLDGSRLGAPRAALFLCRQGRLRGWGSRGYVADAAARLRALTIDGREPDDRWLAPALEPATEVELERRPEQTGPDFGQPPAAEALALVVRVRSKTLAVLLAERSLQDPSLESAVLKMLATVASLRLELDLAWRKFRSARDDERAVRAPEGPGASAPAPRPPAAPAPSAAAPVTELEPAGPSNVRRDEARTFARLVASDIRLYNEEAVMLGRRNRDLARRLGDHLERGRESFRRRFPDMGNEGMTLLDEAYVQVLAAGDPNLLTVG